VVGLVDVHEREPVRLSERSRRHQPILLLSCVFAVGALASSLAPSAALPSATRIVLGFASGGATQTVPRYAAELAPAARRGRLVLTFQVGIGVGIVISTLVGASEQCPGGCPSRLAAVPALLMLVLMLRCRGACVGWSSATGTNTRAVLQRAW
jgi:MFS family permease